jgi:hypothetical protein
VRNYVHLDPRRGDDLHELPPYGELRASRE